jgi:hypothetical protein
LILINVRHVPLRDHPPSKKLMEVVMTTGNVLYLAMSIGMFGLFSAVLAYQSWQQSRQGPDMVSAPLDRHRDTDHQDTDHKHIGDEVTA